MEVFSQIIGTPLGWLMWLLNLIIPNYGVALILFTLIIRALVFPLSIKQQKNTARMSLFQPKLQDLQKKYGNNKQKYQEEMMKLYEEEGYNPMSGCLPMIVQMLVLFGLIDVVYKPLTYITRLSKDVLDNLLTLANQIGPGAVEGFKTIAANDYQRQLKALNVFKDAPDQFTSLGGNVMEALNKIDLNFLGLNLGQTPTFSLSPYLIIPLLSGVTSLLTTIVTQRVMTLSNQKGAELAKTPKQREADAKILAKGGKVETQAPAVPGMNGTMKTMLYIMPLFSLYIAFTVPAGVGLYWTVANLFAIGQSIALYKLYSPEKMAELVKKEQGTRKRKPSRMSQYMKAAQEAQAAQSGGAAAKIPTTAKPAAEEPEDASVDDGQRLSAKEINRRKLAEARRRDAEKYGETYVEVSDKDLE